MNLFKKAATTAYCVALMSAASQITARADDLNEKPTGEQAQNAEVVTPPPSAELVPAAKLPATASSLPLTALLGLLALRGAFALRTLEERGA